MTFHFNEHPVIGFFLTVSMALVSLALKLLELEVVHELLKIAVLIAQLGAALTAIYVGYKTIKKKQ